MAAPNDFYVGVTHNAWFDFLAGIGADDVNFWRPTPGPFHAVPRGGLFLFKLHVPDNFIAGGGFVASTIDLTVRQAWDWFQIANGFPEFDAFLSHMGGRAGRLISCIVLADVFYFPRDWWIPMPASFKLNTVRGKGYRISDDRQLWNDVQSRLRAMSKLPEAQAARETTARFGHPQLVLPRLGQGAFRSVMAEAYNKRCAVTGERALPALEAAHIRPYAAGGPHAPENGLLLRSDLHRLFDAGYMTVDPEARALVVSNRLRTEFHNGHEYLALHGRPIAAPAPEFTPPSGEHLRYHAENVFVA